MVSSYTTNKGFEKPANGDYVDTWQIPVNGDWDIADKALGGTYTVSLTNANVNLTSANCQNVRIVLTGSITGNITVYFPATSAGFFIVTNATTGSYTITLASAGGSPGTSVNIGQGYTNLIFSDGSNVFYGDDPRITLNAGTGITITGTVSPTISLSVPVSVANGGTGAVSLTANSVLVGNGTSTVAGVAPGAAGNVLTSNGTTWTSAAPSGTGGGISSINFATSVGMGLSWNNPNITTSGQTVTLQGTLAMAYGGTGTTGITSGFVKSNGSSLSGGNQINLNSGDVTGVLQPANGGTGTLGTGVSTALGQSISTGSGYIILNNGATLTNADLSGITDASTINSSGTVTANQLVVSASPTSVIGFNNNSTSYYINYSSSSGIFGVYMGGAMYSCSTTNFSVPVNLTVNGIPYCNTATFQPISDIRAKKNIQNYGKSIDALRSLRPVTFQYNGKYGAKDDGITRAGLIAQEILSSSMPELAVPREYVDEDTGEKTEMYTVNPSDLIFALVNAVKELDAKVKELEAKLPA